MQQPPHTKFISGRRAAGATAAALAATAAGLLLALNGCGGPEPTHTDHKGPAHAGAAIRVSCPDKELAAVLTPLAKTWAGRAGATVEVATDPMAPGDAADVGVIPAADLGAWADRGELVPVPSAVKANPAYDDSDVIRAYREHLCGWGGQPLALPLAGDAAVVVYRADRFAEERAKAKFGRPPQPPATWEDFAALAELFAGLDGKPSVALPADPARLTDLFFRVAADYDRRALNQVELAKIRTDPNFEAEVLSFQFRVDTGKPRLGSPGFVEAARWLAGLRDKRCLPDAPGDPVAALAEGRAVLAVLSLAELARLPREGGMVSTRFGIGPQPPAARVYFDPAGKPVARPNYVPYFAGGRLGVVRTRCPRPEAAFDLLADLGGPARSQELVSEARLGVGPFRASQLHRDRLVVWLGYGLDADRSKQLQESMQRGLADDVTNPAFGLRCPDHADLTAALAAELRRLVGGEEKDAAQAMARAVAAWEKLGERVPADKLLAWRRRAAGL